MISKLKKQRILLITFSIISLILLLVLIMLPSEPEKEKLPENYIIEVIDGNTIRLSTGKLVKLACIDAPEFSEQNFKESKTFLENLVLTEEVILVPLEEDKDIYDRLLRYVYINGTFVNKEILEQDHAKLEPDAKECSELFFEE